MTNLIVFAIIGMSEIGPDVCKVDYMRYVDVESVTLPCDFIKLNTVSAGKLDDIK